MRIFAYVAVISMLSVIFLPMATQAQIDVTTVERYIEFNPAYSEPGTVSNLMDEGEQYLEKDVIYGSLPEGVEGRYFGPYLQSTLIQFHQLGGSIRFVSEFNFTSSIIMNGATQFWVRVPLDGRQYERMLLSIENRGDTISHTALDSYGGVLTGARWIDNRIDNEVMFLETGIYVLVRGVFESDMRYVFHVQADAWSETTEHRMYLTMEDYRISRAWDRVQFYGNRTYDHIGEIETYKYDLSIDAGFSWAFVFTSGLGDGLESFRLPFGHAASVYSFMEEDRMGNDGYVSEYFSFRTYPIHNATTNVSYISIYLPFEAPNSVNWNVTLVCMTGSFTDPTDPSPSEFRNWQSWWVNSTNNILLTSSIWEYNLSGPVTGQVDVFLRPVNSQSLPFYMTIPALDYPDYWTVYDGKFILPWARYYSNANESNLDSEFLWCYDTGQTMYFNKWYSHLPLHYVATNGDSRWANVTQTAVETIYDFGWGKGYLYEGETVLVFFLNDGTSRFWYNQTLADGYDPDESKGLLEWLLELVLIVPGIIYDGLTWVWDQIKNIAEVIWANLVKFIGWIIDMATDVYNKVSDIVEGMLYGFPILIVLFLTNYFGNMLYTGKIPKLAKKYSQKQQRRFKRKVKVAGRKGYRILKGSIPDKPSISRGTVRYIRGSPEERLARRDEHSYQKALSRSERSESSRLGKSVYSQRRSSIPASQWRHERVTAASVKKRRRRRHG